MAERNTAIQGKQIKAAAAGLGLEKDSSQNFQVKTDVTGGANLATVVNVSANGVAVKIDDSTVGENGSNQLEVKDDGITEPKLAMNNAPSDGYFISWNQTGGYMEWKSVDETYVTEGDIVKEDESANCNGVTTDFTLDNTPITASVQVYLNGLLQQEGSGNDYTLSGTTVSFNEAPEDDDLLIIHYIKD